MIDGPIDDRITCLRSRKTGIHRCQDLADGLQRVGIFYDLSASRRQQQSAELAESFRYLCRLGLFQACLRELKRFTVSISE